MSDIGIYTVEIKSLESHPYADRLEIAEILGTKTIVRKGEFQIGEVVIYFPPDLMLPEDIIDELNVRNYLKHSRYDKAIKTQCRIYAARIRGIPSYGFVIKNKAEHPVDTDLTGQFRAKKYQPPPRFSCGDALAEKTGFSPYTSIQHFWRFEEIFEQAASDEDIFITEKIHGTNFRLGKIDGEVCIGSHRVRRDPNNAGIYTVPMQDEKLMKAVEENDNIIFYGEVYGQGVQDMDYGTLPTYAIFDIVKDGLFLDPVDTLKLCEEFEIPHVPVLYVGPYSKQIVEQLTCGNTELNPSRNFNGREGIVLKTASTKYHGTLGRVILKSVSADYYARKEQDTSMLFNPGEKYVAKNV